MQSTSDTNDELTRLREEFLKQLAFVHPESSPNRPPWRSICRLQPMKQLGKNEGNEGETRVEFESCLHKDGDVHVMYIVIFL